MTFDPCFYARVAYPILWIKIGEWAVRVRKPMCCGTRAYKETRMKNKEKRIIIESLVMVLAFGLAMVMCVHVMLFSDRLSDSNAARNQAVLVAQQVAEEWRRGEDLSEVYYDMEWNRLTSAERGRYRVDLVQRTGKGDLTSLADITVTEVGGDLIFSMSTARQEDTP